jgi:hypothetical protein
LPRTPLRNSITENELEEMEDIDESFDYSRKRTDGNGDTSTSTSLGQSTMSTTSQIGSSTTPEIRVTPIKRQPNQDSAIHANVARLSPSPRPKHPLGGSTTSNTSSISTSTSRLSSAGSSQYPGEEEDAFHVRSTCELALYIAVAQANGRRPIRGNGSVWRWMGSWSRTYQGWTIEGE